MSISSVGKETVRRVRAEIERLGESAEGRVLMELFPVLGVVADESLNADCLDWFVELARPETSEARRAEIGVLLEDIRDPRPGIGVDEHGIPRFDWCAVDGGEVRVDGFDEAFVVGAFEIARYPVTWGQFHGFLEAPDGYDHADWWLGFPFTEPAFAGDRRDNRPAHGISWFQAAAFCRWVSARSGREIRLPNEWEWQQAACAGDVTKTYPWGPDWVDRVANSAESRIGGPSAVGMYPQGAAANGAADMSGNLCEWCLNDYDHPENTGMVGVGRRPLRGGSFDDGPAGLQLTARRFNMPSHTRDDYGFRVARP
jgi:hypothetical protein